ncbi:hypothetical protein SDC9_59347 [bioreactor metagenome]|uniref:DUF6933 domain-containing protein n=1 Tax=bioreactor metagenome TaxID=1076179 RepID=A0A644X9Y4_9ZZZZ|nr:hypothetical protein [Rikenellaceae bacterium]
MIIRATSKTLNIARIAPVKNLAEIEGPLPGEWYVSLVPTGRKGVSAIHFVHNPTMLSVVVMGRSLNKALEEFPLRAAALLRRFGFVELVQRFEFDSAREIYTTNNRGILSNMNQMKYYIEWEFAMAEELGPAALSLIENRLIKDIISGKIAQGQDYMKPIDVLTRLRDAQEQDASLG